MRKYVEYLKKVAIYVEDYKLRIIITIVLNFLVTFLSLFFPIMNKELIDNIIYKNAWDKLPRFLVLLGLLYMGTVIISLVSNRIYASFSETIWANSRELLFSKVLNQNIMSKLQFAEADIVQRISEDSSSLHVLHSYFFDQIFMNIVTIVGTIIIMFYLNVKLAIISCISIPLFIIITKYFSKKFLVEVKNVKESNSKLRNNLLNALSFFNSIKSNGIENIFMRRYKNINEKTLDAQISTEYTGYLLGSIINIVTNINQLIIISFGAYMIKSGEITAGILIAFLGYSTNLYRPFIKLSSLLKELNSTYVSIDRYLELSNFADNNKENYLNGEELKYIKLIEVNDIGFGYNQEKRVIEGLSFELNQRDIVQIKGRSGVGKSTIAKLFKRLYEIDEGEIIYNDMNYTEFNLLDVRKKISWISQEQVLLDGTIKDYLLSFGDFTESQIYYALDKVNLKNELYNEIENNYSILDIKSDRQGSTLSGGQIQRLLLSRIFLEDSDVLFLDEPFNGIDIKSRDIIWFNIMEKFREKIIVVIDHNEYFDKYNTKIIEI